jgi:hypothetical protein
MPDNLAFHSLKDPIFHRETDATSPIPLLACVGIRQGLTRQGVNGNRDAFSDSSL